jgi:putative nucleotidyltransferase with HDIG domain
LCEGKTVSESVDLNRLASIVEDVPTLPSIMFEVLAIAEDENSTAGDLEEVIMRDQALSAKVLKVANSAYYGIPRTVETVSRATVLLGFQTVVGLALTVSVYDTLWGAGKGHYLDRRELWKHSLGAATGARLLAGNASSRQGAVAFTAGMLHDIGKSIFDTYMPDEYSKVIDSCQKDALQMYEAEGSMLGATHAELGYKVGRRWQLPEVLCESIRRHHSVSEAEESFAKSAAVVSLGDYLARNIGIGQMVEFAPAVIDADAMRIWGGSQADLEKAGKELAEHREKIDAFQP